jgi:excisionase family DNA binding protein
MSNPAVAIEVPVMDIKVFASKVGLSVPTVRGLIDTGRMPIFKMGKRRLINIAELTNRCLSAAKESQGE